MVLTEYRTLIDKRESKRVCSSRQRSRGPYATVFNSAVASIMASTDSYSASAASAQMVALTQRPSVTTNNVQLYQSINTSIASLAKVARESKKALENAVKYL